MTDNHNEHTDRAPGRGRIYASIAETIGDTPIVRLDKLARVNGVGANLLAKLEFFNPIAKRERPYRRLHDRGDGAGRKDRARKERSHRADLRQHRALRLPLWPPRMATA